MVYDIPLPVPALEYICAPFNLVKAVLDCSNNNIQHVKLNDTIAHCTEILGNVLTRDMMILFFFSYIIITTSLFGQFGKIKRYGYLEYFETHWRHCFSCANFFWFWF